MFNIVGGVFCLVFLVMSWFLSTKIEKPQENRQTVISRRQTVEIENQPLAISYQLSAKNESTEKTKEQTKEKRRILRKPSKQLREVDKKPSVTFGIPIEREKTWQLKERRVALGPQAIVKISIGEEPIPLRGGLGVSAPREMKKNEVFPPNILSK